VLGSNVMARALDCSMVAVNRVNITGAPIPFGGTKQSGLGREGSRYGSEAGAARQLERTCRLGSRLLVPSLGA
jgi:acyl-CoA reductase-like NAD-dependent aldehyde dehydrogenase